MKLGTRLISGLLTAVAAGVLVAALYHAAGGGAGVGRVDHARAVAASEADWTAIHTAANLDGKVDAAIMLTTDDATRVRHDPASDEVQAAAH